LPEKYSLKNVKIGWNQTRIHSQGLPVAGGSVQQVLQGSFDIFLKRYTGTY